MNRKEFLAASLTAVGTTALLPILNNHAFAAEAESCDQQLGREHGFRDFWIPTLLANMDANLTPEQRSEVMQANGRACVRRLKQLAEQKGKGADAPFNMLVSWLTKDKASRQGNEMTFVLDKCSCPMLASGPTKLSETWCNCSVGWFRELFENATGQKVRVDLKSAIRRGDPVCKFVVNV